MNKTIISGTLGRDAELKKGKNGYYLFYNVAVDERKEDGSYSTTWITATQNVKEGTTLAEYLRKGTRVIVEGKVTPYMLSNMEKPKLNIFVDRIELLSKKYQNGENQIL